MIDLFRKETDKTWEMWTKRVDDSSDWFWKAKQYLQKITKTQEEIQEITRKAIEETITNKENK